MLTEGASKDNRDYDTSPTLPHMPIATRTRSLDRHTLGGDDTAPQALALPSELRHVVEHHSKHAPTSLLDRQGRLMPVLRAGTTSTRHENDASGTS